MQQAINAIKAKYNISDEDAKKVLGVLIAAEHKRQTGDITPRGGLISGASMPGRGSGTPSGMKSADARGIDAGDLLGIAGSLLGGGGQQSSGGGGLGGLVGGLLGGQSNQQGGGADILGIVGDLIGGASNHPNQGGGGADLGGVLNGLLGGQPGHQSSDPLGSLLGGLMGGGQAQPTQQQQPSGGAGDLLGLLGGLVGGAGGQQGAQSGDLGGLLGSLLGGGGAAPQQSQQPTQGGGATFYSPQDVGHDQSGHPSSAQGGGAHLGEGTPGGSGKKDYGSIEDAMHKMSGAVHEKPDKLGKMGKDKGKPGAMPSGKEKK
jgi:hypothetical protein